MPGYERDQPLLDYDPQRARRLIAESQYGDPSQFPVVTLSVGGSGVEMDRVTEAIVAMYRENLGIEIDVERSADVLSDRPQLFSLGWIADYPDPEDFLDILFHSASPLNRMNYSNSSVDRLLEAARIEQAPERRMLLYTEAEEVIVSDAPWVPLWHSVDYVLTKPYVRDVSHAAAIFPWLCDAYLER
jgi:ABC-type oligopeptide transport system substrate-binding subunit